MELRNLCKKKLIIRNSCLKNVNKLRLLDSGAFYYSFEKGCSFETLVSCFSMLRLITNKSPVFVLSKKSIASAKIRKGHPVGVKLNFRKRHLESIFFMLLNQILPATNLNFSVNLKRNKELVLSFNIADIFVFSYLRVFYFYFNKFQSLRIMLKFNSKLTPNTPKFLLNVLELPYK